MTNWILPLIFNGNVKTFTAAPSRDVHCVLCLWNFACVSQHPRTMIWIAGVSCCDFVRAQALQCIVKIP